MAYEQKPNSGALFRAKNKQQENWPDYEGSAVIDGVDYWLSGWINSTKTDGSKYFSLKFKRKDAPKLSNADKPRPALAAEIPSRTDDDDVPF